MVLILTETDAGSNDPYDSSSCGFPISDNSVTSSKEATSGGTAGVTAVSMTMDGLSGSFQNFLQFESAAGEPNSTDWPAGDWTVRIEITTANMNIDQWAIGYCRKNSAGVPQQGLGSAKDISVGFGTVGVKTITDAGLAGTSELATDQIGVTLSCVHFVIGKTQTFGFKPSQNIDTPLAGAAAVSLLWHRQSPSSRAILGG